MKLILELSEDTTAQLTALWPDEKERLYFCINAIRDALALRENENNVQHLPANQATDNMSAEKAD